ncbi:MAG: FAD:protein FMN transferase [Acidimicrobiales bacterium]
MSATKSDTKWASTQHRLDRRGRAMGTSFHLIVVGGSSEVGDRMERQLHHLESIWSRFVPSSEISELNAAPDNYQLVSEETAELIERGVQGWALTGGVFDPTILQAMMANGYDRTFSQCGNEEPAHRAGASIGCGGIEVNRTINLVRLGPGVGFDPGGIGKGLAADLIVADAMANGAAGAMANIGGDLVCRGEAPTGQGWVIDVTERSVRDERVALLTLEEGAVATSTTRKRRWRTADGERHHLLDPATGDSSSGPTMVTVIAAQGWYAEVVAKHLIVSGDPTVIDTDLAAAIVIEQGDPTGHTTIGEMGGYLR